MDQFLFADATHRLKFTNTALTNASHRNDYCNICVNKQVQVTFWPVKVVKVNPYINWNIKFVRLNASVNNYCSFFFGNITLIKMTFRLSADRKATSLDTVRDMADEFMTKSHEILSRADARVHHNHISFYAANIENRCVSKRVRVISVIVFGLSVTACAIILGIYYTYMYHPNTERLFGQKPGI